jgi:hypothetical protein
MTVVNCLIWMLVVGVGLAFTWSYESTPGQAASPAVMWPAESKIQRSANRSTLVLFAHPQCPCTRASIEELARIVARSQGQLAAYVLFIKPSGTPLNWEKTALWRNAAAIPGVKVRSDYGSTEARHFDASTSGQTILFNRDGQLLFTGGITATRGHSGENEGSDAIIDLVTTGKTRHKKTLVFGCALASPEAPQK